MHKEARAGAAHMPRDGLASLSLFRVQPLRAAPAGMQRTFMMILLRLQFFFWYHGVPPERQLNGWTVKRPESRLDSAFFIADVVFPNFFPFRQRHRR